MADCQLVPTNRVHGYVGVQIDGRWQYAHRVAYEREVGPIPEGMTIDHLCNQKNCMETSHMEVVTRAENTRRAHERRGNLVDITKPCRRGHPPNWYKPPRQWWRCRTCVIEDRAR